MFERSIEGLGSQAGAVLQRSKTTPAHPPHAFAAADERDARNRIRLANELQSDDFEVISLASDHDWEGVRGALSNGAPFKVFLDPPADDGNIGAIAARWGIKAVPESALIDRQGNIRAYFVNKRDWESPVAQTCLRAVIDEE